MDGVLGLTWRDAQMHLADFDKNLDKLNAYMPGLGHDWNRILGHDPKNIFLKLAAYAIQWEVVAARWAEDDYAQLQPTEPAWNLPAAFIISSLMAKVAAKELELCAEY
jgi:hypothetical protein